MRLIISPIRVCLTSTCFASFLKPLLTHCQLPYTQRHLPGGKAPVEWYPAGFSPWCSRSVIGQALLQANEVSRSNVHAGFPWLSSKAPKRSPKNWLLALLVPPPQLELIDLITFFQFFPQCQASVQELLGSNLGFFHWPFSLRATAAGAWSSGCISSQSSLVAASVARL